MFYLLAMQRSDQRILLQARLHRDSEISCGRHPSNQLIIDDPGIALFHFRLRMHHNTLTVAFLPGAQRWKKRWWGYLPWPRTRAEQRTLDFTVEAKPERYLLGQIEFCIFPPHTWSASPLRRPKSPRVKISRPHLRPWLVMLGLLPAFFATAHIVRPKMQIPPPKPPHFLIPRLPEPQILDSAATLPTPPLQSKDKRASPPPSDAIGRILHAFQAGEEDQALVQLQDLYDRAPFSAEGQRAGETMKHLHEILVQRRALQSLPRRGTARPWWQLLEREKTCLGKASLKTRNAALASLLDEASQFHNHGEKAAAFAMWTQALRLETNNGAARRGLALLNKDAQIAFEQAYAIEHLNPERAKREFAAILAYLPTTAPLRAKICRHLSKPSTIASSGQAPVEKPASCGRSTAD